MPSKTPRDNGKKPVENGVRSSKDSKKSSSKTKKASKDGDEEMTVVVPPPKATKQSSAPPPADVDGDVSMGDEEKIEDETAKVDPVAQTVAGKLGTHPLRGSSAC